MQKRVALFVFFLVALMLVSFGQEVAATAVKGPFVDTLYVNTRMKEEIGLKDAAEGITDIFAWGVSGKTLYDLPAADLEKLEVYNVPSGSWSLNINNYPGAAPYQVELADGSITMNPWAINEVRFALNFLINRKYLVDEVLGGAGFPMYTMATTGQPGTYRYNQLVEEFGFTPEGDEEKAIAMITEAMEKAAALPENQGRLVMKDGFWHFDGQPVLTRFLIRVDDPNGRLIEGNYVSDQLEKAGLKVERLLWDRVKAVMTSYYGNPKDFEWQIYTEGWGAGATRRYWEHIVAQMYAPWYGYMPGGAEPSNWNHSSPMLDEYTKNAFYGRFVTVEEYWQNALEGLRIGLQEALRVYVCAQEDFYVANKAAFKNRFAYGKGDGLNQWSFITADTYDGELTITEFSAMGGLFMSAWDPVGADGFSDTYSNLIAESMTDTGSFESPVSAVNTPNRAVWDPASVESDVVRVGDEIVGRIPVPADAIVYNWQARQWEAVGEGVTSKSKATFTFRFGNYHNGAPMRLADLFYFNAFIKEWTTQNGDDDPWYEANYSSSLVDGIDLLKGWVIHDDGSMTAYYDYSFPADLDRVAARCAPDFTVTAAGAGVGVAWDIIEALALLVVEGSESGTIYSFSADADNELDVLIPGHVADIKAKLQEMHDRGHVPSSIADRITVDEAKAQYKASIDFIDAYGHAYISNGPFWLKEYDPTSNFMELAANRDPSYPYNAQYWVEKFAVPTLEINRVTVPAVLPRGNDLVVKVDLAKVIYPSITQQPADEGNVVVRILTADGEISESGNVINTGEFKISIPGTQMNDLQPGTYKVMVEASLPGALTVSRTQNILIW